MPYRLRGLSPEAYASLEAEMEQMAERMAQIGNIIGPAFGAKWCDKALTLHRSIDRLRMQIEDCHYEFQQHSGRRLYRANLMAKSVKPTSGGG